MTPVPHRVVGVVNETPDVVMLTVEPVADELAAIRPGRFVMVWAFGVGEIPVSVSGVADGGRVGLTVRGVGAVSDAIVAARSRGSPRSPRSVRHRVADRGGGRS